MSSPLPLVVKLNTRLPHVDVTVSTSTRFHELAARQVGLLGRASRRRRGFLRHDAPEQDAERDRDEPGTTNAMRQPKYFTRKPGQHGRDGDAEIADEPVDADDGARARRVLHEHRDADRMVDGRERAHQRERGRELPRVLRDRGKQARHADAEVEHDHHRAPAPVVAQPSRRHRAQAEQHERARRVRHQVLPAREAEVDRDRADGGREDQQDEMVDRVRDVEEQRRERRVLDDVGGRRWRRWRSGGGMRLATLPVDGDARGEAQN